MNICIACGSDKNRIIFDMIREEKRDVFRCDSCGFVWLGKSKDNSLMKTAEYYNSDEYISKCYETTWGFDERKDKRKKSLANSIRDIAAIIKGENISSCLEVGASVGAVAEGLMEVLPDIYLYGVELNRAEADYLAGILGGKNVFYTLKDALATGKKFDMVYGIHVFEHFEYPLKELEIIRLLLKPRGILFLEMPNHDDYYIHALSGQKREKYMEFMYHKAHPFYYNKKSFSAIIKKTDFSIEYINTRQDYPIVNFFHWLLNGGPQKNISDATSLGVEKENSIAWQLMNKLDEDFRNFIEKSGYGCSLVCLLKA